MTNTPDIPDDMTREEYREALVTSPEDDTPTEKEEDKEPGYLARTRKASMAGAIALAGSLSTAAIAVSQDGQITTEELISAAIISVGFGVAAWFGTWAVPNAKK